MIQNYVQSSVVLFGDTPQNLLSLMYMRIMHCLLRLPNYMQHSMSIYDIVLSSASFHSSHILEDNFVKDIENIICNETRR